MNEKMGELADIDMHWITGTHTGDKYLLGYHYEVNGVHFIGLSPDPDAYGIWSQQGYGFHPDTLKWFKETLKRIDPTEMRSSLLTAISIWRTESMTRSKRPVRQIKIFFP